MDKLEKLYNKLKADGLYTKSFDDFVEQFSSPEKQKLLYDNLFDDGLYTKTLEDFQEQFFSDLKKRPTRRFFGCGRWYIRFGRWVLGVWRIRA